MKNNKNKFGLNSLKKQFPTDDACLEFIFSTLHSKKCSCGGEYHKVSGRKKYQCSKCRFQIAPTAGTIFHKSDTPLSLWFYAILVFSNAKSGISAKQMQSNLEVTYKCAYRILKHIREALKQDDKQLRGDVEVDTALWGGRGNAGKNNENLSAVIAKKAVIIAGVERGGRIKAEVVEDAGGYVMKDFIQRNVATKATSLITDNSVVYKSSDKTHDRYSVNHSKREFVRGDIHINTIETFFAHLKRSIRGTFKNVSNQKLQSYLDSFVFHYNNRHSDKARFEVLLGALLHASK